MCLLLSCLVLTACGEDAGTPAAPAPEQDAGTDAEPDVEDEPDPEPEPQPEPDPEPSPNPEPEVTELPPPLIDDRLIEARERTEMLSEQIDLPDDRLGSSAVFPAQASPVHGHVSAGGRLYGVGRDGELRPLAPGWDIDVDLGRALAVVADVDDSLLVSTEIGLLYEAEGALWPSPVSEVVLSPIRRILVEEVLDSRGRTGRWFGSDRGLFYLLGEEIFHVGPADEMLGRPVRHFALGPDPVNPLGKALWVAYDDALYTLRPDGDGLEVFEIAIDFPGEILSIGADHDDWVWIATSSRIFSRQPGTVLGAARWTRWEMPARREARNVTVGADGAVWLLTNLTVYRSLDRFEWEAALVGPVEDIVAIAPAAQGSAWITREGGLAHNFVAPPVSLVGVEQGDLLESMPDLSVFPTLPEAAREVSVRVDGCAPVVFQQAPYEVIGGGAIWADCLTFGPHELVVEVDYAQGLPRARLSVGFDWGERRRVTWDGDIEPLYMRYCARSGCHAGGFAPDSFETWVEKINPIIVRTGLPEGEPGRMPPNGAVPTAEELELLRWWRDDGTPRQ